MSERLAGVRVADGQVAVGVEWDAGYCEVRLTEAEARILLDELDAALLEVSHDFDPRYAKTKDDP